MISTVYIEEQRVAFISFCDSGIVAGSCEGLPSVIMEGGNRPSEDSRSKLCIKLLSIVGLLKEIRDFGWCLLWLFLSIYKLSNQSSNILLSE